MPNSSNTSGIGGYSAEDLGAALAWLRATWRESGEKAAATAEPALSASQNACLRQLRQRLGEIASSHGTVAWSEQLPEQRCPGERPALQNALDLLIYITILNQRQEQAEPHSHCGTLTVHLNHCDLCFEIYLNIMRAYTKTTLALRQDGSPQ